MKYKFFRKFAYLERLILKNCLWSRSYTTETILRDTLQIKYVCGAEDGFLVEKGHCGGQHTLKKCPLEFKNYWIKFLKMCYK